MVDYLNAVNAPYRSGQQVSTGTCWKTIARIWRIMCSPWRAVLAGVADRPPISDLPFDFPVPKNEFVNLMRRTNDMPIADPSALYDDATARVTLMREGWIATGPAGSPRRRASIQPNEIYDTDLRLIFYDDPPFGHYQRPLRDRIFSEPRYTDLTANLRYFSALYAAILAGRRAAKADRHAAFWPALLQGYRRQRKRRPTRRCRVCRAVEVLNPMQACASARCVSSPASAPAQAATLDALRSGFSGLRPCTFETVRSRPGPARSRPRQVPPARRVRRFDLSQQPAGGTRAGAGRFPRRGRRGDRALWRGPGRAVRRHQHVGHPADRSWRSGRDRDPAHLPARFHYEQTQNTGSLAAYLRHRSGTCRTILRDVLRLRIVRQSLRARARG